MRFKQFGGVLRLSYLSFNVAGEKGGKEGLKKDSRGDEDETASVTSYESSMVIKHKHGLILICQYAGVWLVQSLKVLCNMALPLTNKIQSRIEFKLRPFLRRVCYFRGGKASN